MISRQDLRGFPAQFAGLNAKSDHHCKGSLNPKEFALVVASTVKEIDVILAKVIQLSWQILPNYLKGRKIFSSYFLLIAQL